MARHNTNDDHDDTERALTEVLQAERDATRAVLDCEKQANALLAEARNRARLISERADARISTLEARCERAIAQHLNELARADAAHASAPPTVDQKALQNAVDVLAAELSGIEEAAEPPENSPTEAK